MWTAQIWLDGFLKNRTQSWISWEGRVDHIGVDGRGDYDRNTLFDILNELIKIATKMLYFVRFCFVLFCFQSKHTLSGDLGLSLLMWLAPNFSIDITVCHWNLCAPGPLRKRLHLGHAAPLDWRDYKVLQLLHSSMTQYLPWFSLWLHA